MISSWLRIERVTTARCLSFCAALCRRFRLEIRMNDRAVTGEYGGFHNIVVPVDGERFGLFIDQDFQERIEVPGVKARRRRGEPAGYVAIADDFDAVDVRNGIS